MSIKLSRAKSVSHFFDALSSKKNDPKCNFLRHYASLNPTYGVYRVMNEGTQAWDILKPREKRIFNMLVLKRLVCERSLEEKKKAAEKQKRSKVPPPKTTKRRAAATQTPPIKQRPAVQ